MEQAVVSVERNASSAEFIVILALLMAMGIGGYLLYKKFFEGPPEETWVELDSVASAAHMRLLV